MCCKSFNSEWIQCNFLCCSHTYTHPPPGKGIIDQYFCLFSVLSILFLLARLSIFYYKVFSKIKVFCKTTLSPSLPSKHRHEDLSSLTFKKGNVILYINHQQMSLFFLYSGVRSFFYEVVNISLLWDLKWPWGQVADIQTHM